MSLARVKTDWTPPEWLTAAATKLQPRLSLGSFSRGGLLSLCHPVLPMEVVDGAKDSVQKERMVSRD